LANKGDVRIVAEAISSLERNSWGIVLMEIDSSHWNSWNYVLELLQMNVIKNNPGFLMMTTLI